MQRLLISLMLLASPVLAQDAEIGAGLFFSHCAGCHGVDAMGDGPMAKIMTVRPPDLTVIAARNAGEFPRAQVAFRIDGRDPMLAHGGPMPMFGETFGEDVVAVKTRSGQPILAGQGIVDLLAYLESIQR